MEEPERIAAQLAGLDDPIALLAGLFAHAPVGFQIYQADGHCLLVNKAFRDLFGSEPPPEYNVLQDDVAARAGFLDLVRRAFAGETVQVPPHWYDPRELRQVEVTEGRRVAIEVTLFPLHDRQGTVRHVALCFRDVTAQQELAAATEAVRFREEELAATVQSIGDGVIATDNDGRVVRMNPVAERLTGWRLAEARGRHLGDVFRIFDEETRRPVEAPVARVVREGAVIDLAKHTLLVGRDGAEHAIDDSAAPIRDEAGTIRGVVLVFRDVSEERRADRERDRSEAALRRSEELLRLALGAGRMVAFEADLARGTLACSDNVVDVLGYRPTRTDEGYAHVHPADHPLLRESLASARDNGVLIDLRYRIIRPDDGRVVWIERRGELVRDAAGRTIGARGVMVDITERREAEVALSRSAVHLAAAQAITHCGSWELDLANLDDLNVNPLRWSDEVFRIFGYEPGAIEVSNEAFFRAVHPDDRALIAAAVRGAIETGREYSLDHRIVRPDGTIRIVHEQSEIQRDADGRPILMVGTVHDVTEQKRAEELRGRTAELELQNRRIQEANRLKSEFLANMSHELRTPLNAIIGFAELLHDGVVPATSPQHKEFLGDVLASGRHLHQLINDVLDLAKVEAGKLEFRPEPVDVGKLIGEVCAILRTQVAQKRIRLAVEVSPALADVSLDPARFKQVLYNYLSNALKFTPEAGRVAVRALPHEGGGLRLEVEDTGSGIAPVDIGRLFVEFQQLDAGLTKRHQGTGLGLALTRRLVEAQGGSVDVRSAPGVGSVFSAIYPRIDDARPPAPTRAGVRRGSRTILVVEDDEPDQELLLRVLADAGYSVEIAASGAEALEKCRGRSFDAVTLDLLLPDMNGLELLAGIRASGNNRGVPVIVASVVAGAGVVAGFEVNDVLHKPLAPEAILGALARIGIAPETQGGILVVDDDERALRLMEATLSPLGYQIICRTSATAGLAVAEQTPPVAVVLDLLMPEMDGFAFLERFRALPGHRRTPVLIWTMKELTTDELGRLRGSAEAVVSKGSSSASALLAELRAVLPGTQEER